MVELIQKFWVSEIWILKKIGNISKPFLEYLDPSLFQNITLGVLAIFIPFAIVFLTDVLNSKKEARSQFEKMVLSDEVLGTKKIFWLAIVSIVFFAFFSGTDVPTAAKIVTIFAALILIILFWDPFKKVLKFSEGNKAEFEKSFLKKMRFSKTLFKFRNEKKAEKMVSAWNSIWSEKSEFYERDFTEIFTTHIDDAIMHRKFELAMQLAKIYVDNIGKRLVIPLVSTKILPKVLVWSEIFWREDQLWLKRHGKEKRNQTLKSWVLKILNKDNPKSELFWGWNDFAEEFFQVITKTLLNVRNGSYQLLSSFKNHIEEYTKNLNKIGDTKNKEKCDEYIKSLLAVFCPTFFSEICEVPSSLNDVILNDYFPAEWKITDANKKNCIPRVILHEFLKWSKIRIFKEGNNDFDKGLSEVINGIFPRVHRLLFTSFLMLFFSSEVKYAIEKERYFYIPGSREPWDVPSDVSKEQRDIWLAKMKRDEIESQRDETIKIIINFFSHYWNELKISLNDENKNKWENADSKEREVMLKNARKKKLEKIKYDIESNEIKKLCENDERKELYRKKMLELIELLILEIEK